MLLLCCALTVASESVVLEAESFTLETGWSVGTTRSDRAPGGLSGGAALSANTADARATAEIELPEGRYGVWVRAYDWGHAPQPNHYDFTLSVNGMEKVLAVSEPLFASFVWEKWGETSGGTVALALLNADPWASVVDAIAFMPEGVEPPVGQPLPVKHKDVSGDPVRGMSVDATFDVPPDAAKRVDIALAGPEGGGLSGSIVWQEEVALEPVGRGLRLQCDVPPIDHAWPGDYTVYVGLPVAEWGGGAPLTNVTQPAHAMPEPVSAVVSTEHSTPTLLINGEPLFPFAYLMHDGDRDKQYGQMAAAGVRFYSCGSSLGNGPEGFDPRGIDEVFLAILRHQPNALIFPRVGITAPQWWLDEHPEDAVVFDDGNTGPPSMFSKAWLEAACEWTEDYSRYLRSSPYADHIIGIHICTGYTGEWQSWGLWDNLRGDFSPVATQAWREYLRTRYGADAALAGAWNRAVTFDTAAIPTRARRESESPFLRSPAEYQDVIDFYDFYWRGTAEAIEAVSAAAKRGGGRDWLVGVFYGYAIQYGGKMQESQHLGLQRVLDCPDVDFLCSPAMYSLREPGGTSTFMSFTDSIYAHGKFWWDEADNRTYLQKDELARAVDQFETLNVLEREFAHAYTRGAGIWWFDMWGGWYDDPAILTLFEQMRGFGETAPRAWSPAVEIAFVFDDKSAYRIAPDSPYLGHAFTNVMAHAPRLGVPYHTWLLSDLDKMPPYQVYFFPLACDLTDEELARIEALKRDGAVLAFFGPAGVGRIRSGRVEEPAGAQEELLSFTPSGERDGRTFADHRVYWAASPTVDQLHAIAREAGVHLYCVPGDAFYAGNGMVALHAATEGVKTIRFPELVRAQEELSDAPMVSERTNTLTFSLNAKETRCFLIEPVQ